MAAIAKRGWNPALFLLRGQRQPRTMTITRTMTMTTTARMTTSTKTTTTKRRWSSGVSIWDSDWSALRAVPLGADCPFRTPLTARIDAHASAALPVERRRFLAVQPDSATNPSGSKRPFPADPKNATTTAGTVRSSSPRARVSSSSSSSSSHPHPRTTRPKRRRWDDYYDHLVRYRQRVGHPNVPQHCTVPERDDDDDDDEDHDMDHDTEHDTEHAPDFSEPFEASATTTPVAAADAAAASSDVVVPLGKWLDKQRQLHANGTLEATRFRKLDALGVAWDVRSWNWDGMVRRLVSFSEKHGHAHVPQTTQWEGANLGAWLKDVRQRKLEGSLDRSRRERLEELGVVWDMHSWRWNRMFALLVRYRERRGTTVVKQTHKESGENLGRWCSRQKEAYRNGTLDRERFRKLEELGFSWSSSSAAATKPTKTKVGPKKKKAKGQPETKPAKRSRELQRTRYE